MIKQYEGAVHLRLRGAALEPEAVSRELGLAPHTAARANQPLGQEASTRAPAASLLLPLGSWQRYAPPEVARLQLEDQVAHWVSVLEPKAKALRRLRSLGIEIALTGFLTTTSAAALALAPETLARLGRLGVRLELSLFAGREEADSAF